MNCKTQTRNQASLLSSGKFWALTLLLILIYTAFIFAQSTVYIDPTNSGDPGQNGSIDHPFDQWADVTFVSGNTYLQKCGTTYVIGSQIYLLDKSHITLGSYDTGPKPIIHRLSGTGDIIRIRRCQTIIIDGFELKGDLDALSTNGAWNANGVEASGSSLSTTAVNHDIQIRNCDIHQCYNGVRAIRANNTWDWASDSLLVENCNIYNIDEDGIFFSYATYPMIIGCHFWDINMNWFKGVTAPGDAIQLTWGSKYWKINNNIVDRRTTAGKFAVIVSNLPSTTTPEYVGEFIGNTIYPPKDTVSRWPGDQTGGAGLYLEGEYYVDIAYNKFIGRDYPVASNGTKQRGAGALYIQNNGTINCYYNIFDSTTAGSTIHDVNTALYFRNNTLISGQGDNGSFNFIQNISDIYDGFVQNNISAGNTTGNPLRITTPNTTNSNNLYVIGNDNTWNSYFGIIDWENSDFHLTGSSIARNAGVNYNDYYYDFDSIPTPQENTRDIGSCEYTDGGQTTNNPPVIANQAFSINENSPNGTLVGTVLATDPDAGQTLTFSIIGGNTNNAFQINANTGALSVNNSAALNYEAITTFGLTVRAQDNGQGNLYSQATVTVNLANVNENPNISNQTFAIAENSPNGQQAGVVVATDPDAGQTLTYSIISGNAGNAFAINANTGALSVNNSTALNYEAITTFGLTVRVQDNGQGNLYTQATVTVNLTNVNENPNISNQTFSIAENSLNGQQAGVVVATDPDAGQTLTYSIISGNTGNAFAINANTGALSINNSTALNYEVITSFGLTVRAQDNGQGNLYSQATVTVNLTDVNENPNISNQTFWVPENSPNGYQVGIVIANDPDNGQQLTYSLLGGNTDNAFTINSATGAVIVANSSAINSAVNPVFNLIVEVVDNGSGNLSSQAIISVNVTDSNQPPQISNQAFSIAENSPNGQQVGTVVATDPDAGQSLTYSIISGNTGLAFAINTITGTLSVNYSGSLNYELISTFELVVRVQDNGPGTLYSQAIVTISLIDVNENPELLNQTFSINENSVNGQQVGTVVATDPDAGQTLTYSIINGNSDNAFAINANTGVLSVNHSSALNYEVTPSFGLTVRVQDNGQGNLYSQATVTVNLTDVNENPDINNQAFSINENSPDGQQVGTVVATDPDAGQMLTYSIINGNTYNAFAINENTGDLIVNNSVALNYEVIMSFGLTVQVLDNGQGNLYSQAVITVNLIDINENPDISNQTFYIEENSQNGTLAGMVVASDPDAGQTLTYSIIDGNTDNAFAIDANTGVLIVNNSSALNFELNPFFWLTIRVQDNGPGNLFSQAIITVGLMNINVNIHEIISGLQAACYLYPNPANNFINVNIVNFEEELVIISLIDLRGEVIIRQECEVLDGGLLKRIDIEELRKGLYIVNIQAGDRMLFEKFIKL